MLLQGVAWLFAGLGAAGGAYYAHSQGYLASVFGGSAPAPAGPAKVEKDMVQCSTYCWRLVPELRSPVPLADQDHEAGLWCRQGGHR